MRCGKMETGEEDKGRRNKSKVMHGVCVRARDRENGKGKAGREG